MPKFRPTNLLIVFSKNHSLALFPPLPATPRIAPVAHLTATTDITLQFRSNAPGITAQHRSTYSQSRPDPRLRLPQSEISPLPTFLSSAQMRSPTSTDSLPFF